MWIRCSAISDKPSKAEDQGQKTNFNMCTTAHIELNNSRTKWYKKCKFGLCIASVTYDIICGEKVEGQGQQASESPGIKVQLKS